MFNFDILCPKNNSKNKNSRIKNLSKAARLSEILAANGQSNLITRTAGRPLIVLETTAKSESNTLSGRGSTNRNIYCLSKNVLSGRGLSLEFHILNKQSLHNKVHPLAASIFAFYGFTSKEIFKI